MDVGTAKPTPEEITQIPHHCIDIIEPDDYFSAGEFGILARRIVEEIFKRMHLPIVAGGSGLYIRALVDGLFSSNVRDDDVRKALRDRADDEGWIALHQYLCEVDPEVGERIHPNDRKRIIRALEVYQLTGKPISECQRSRTIAAPFDPIFYGLSWKRETLYSRIDERVDEMIQSGLIDEVSRLRSMGYSSSLNSMDSVGYKEIFAFLDGRISMEEAIGMIKRNTRRFAKRQMAWFRRDARIRWIQLEDPVDWQSIAQTMIAESGIDKTSVGER